MTNESHNNGVVALVSIVGCALVALLLFSIFGPYDKANAENTVTPVTEVDDMIKTLRSYQAEEEKHLVLCHELEVAADECAATLKTCVDMLQSNYLIPKRTAEKEK
jgi:hypothetical protein